MGTGLSVMAHMGPGPGVGRGEEIGRSKMKVKFLLCKEELGSRQTALDTGSPESTGNAEVALVTGRRILRAEYCGAYIFFLWLFCLI